MSPRPKPAIAEAVESRRTRYRDVRAGRRPSSNRRIQEDRLHREPLTAEFVSCLAQAFDAASLDDNSAAAMRRMRAALEKPAPVGRPARNRLQVCDHLEEALVIARAHSAPLARLADAFEALAPSLAWLPRPSGGANASPNWPGGHANATVIGLNGLEERRDVVIGASLLAPNVRYPDHSHAPEEVYLLLSPGRFQHGDSGWFDPGTGGTLYNEPGIRHAMASDDVPLLAIWCLWNDEAAARP